MCHNHYKENFNGWYSQPVRWYRISGRVVQLNRAVCHERPLFTNAGMDIKTLQYVMGHSDVGVTLNVYTHASYDRAAEQMAKIIDFKGTVTPEKQRKSG